MNQNILRDYEISQIYLKCEIGGLRKKFSVKLRFMDKKECFFAMPCVQNFIKPKRKSAAEIIVYTVDGVYTTQVNLIDTTISMNDVLFNVTIPKTWNFKQLRQSSRKVIRLPFNVKFNDGFEISGETHDLSVGGFTFVRDSFSSIYERISCIATIEMPDMIINFPDKKLITEAIYSRKKMLNNEYNNGVLYAFKFVKLSYDEKDILKNYLMSLE